MPQGASARRYAEAAFDLAKKHNALERWQSDLRTAAGVLANPRLVQTLESPKWPRERKRQLLDGALTVAIDPLVRNLLYLLVGRGRVGLIGRIADEFTSLYNREMGIVIAEVTTAVDLNEAQRKEVETRLRILTGARRIELRAQTDPRIIGGMIARVGDLLYDGSVRTRLSELQERLS